MSDVVMVAVLGAALLHATWNALVKGGWDKGASLVAVVLGHVLPAAVVLPLVPAPAPASWPWLLAGAGLHAGYQGFLLLAYRTGDLSRVYPIARGSAPLIVALVSVGFLGVALGGAELLAILVIAAGIAGVCLVGGANGAPDRRGTGFALVTGGFIAAYSLVDGTGARLAGSALGFYGWLTLVNALIVIGAVRAVRPGLLGRVARTGKRVALVGGGASFAAYAIVVWAFTQAPIPLVAALRETSIVFALLIAVLHLKERLSLAKVVATTTTLVGVALLRFAR